MTSQAVALQNLGNWIEAESLARRAADGLRKSQGPKQTGTIRAIRVLASFLQQRGRPAEAEPLLREAVASLRGTLAKGDWQLAEAENQWGGCLLAPGRTDQAASLLEGSYRILASSKRISPWQLRKALDRIIALHQARGDSAEESACRIKTMDLDFPPDPFAP
jgi:hypothetical protein